MEKIVQWQRDSLAFYHTFFNSPGWERANKVVICVIRVARSYRASDVDVIHSIWAKTNDIIVYVQHMVQVFVLIVYGLMTKHQLLIYFLINLFTGKTYCEQSLSFPNFSGAREGDDWVASADATTARSAIAEKKEKESSQSFPPSPQSFRLLNPPLLSLIIYE